MKMKLTQVTISVAFALCSMGANSTEFDLSFLQGGANIDTAAWEHINSKYIPGRYFVDVSLNNRELGKRVLTVTDKDQDTLCLSQAWLNDAKIHINTEFYSPYFDAARQCYLLTKEPNTHIDFDFSVQKLNFKMPQKGFNRKVDIPQDWNYGMPAARINYNVNANVNDIGTSVYSSMGVTGNLGKWVATTSVSLSQDNIDVPMITATRALYDLKSDLSIGKTFVSNSLVGGASLFGVSLSSNSSMKPNDLGYTPVFSGVAKSDARVTLTQNGSVIYSEMVPPGPFEIKNANLLNSGDVTMTITENDGSESTQLFPLTIVPNMMNPGESEFSFSTGLRDSHGESELPGLFAAGYYGYGYDGYTLKTSGLFHPQYVGFGGSLIRGLGEWGTMGFEASYSRAKYNDDTVYNGGKFSLTYAKTFNKNTSIQLIGAQYTSKYYTQFSEFSPASVERYTSDRQKTEYQLSLSHQLTDDTSAGLTAWHRIYWGRDDTTSGSTLSLSTRVFDNISLSLSGNYNKIGDNAGYGVAASVAIPLTVLDKDISSYGTVSVSDSGQQNYTFGMSSAITDQWDYSTSVGFSTDSDNKDYTLSSNYRGNRALIGGRLSQNSRGTTGSASVSGSVILLPTKRDLIFTRNISDTIAIANVDDTPGVKFRSSPYLTNGRGNAVVPLNSYSVNDVTLDGNTLPIDIELMTTEQKVIPSAGAVVDMTFDAVQVKRYLFQIKDKDGKFIPNGTWATSLAGVPLGFIAQNGVLFVNSVDELDGLKLGDCTIPGSKIKNTDKLQEVTCGD